MYLITFWDVDRGGLYWLTVSMYILLAIIVFWLRRPFLTIGRTSLTTRKFTGLKIVNAEDIKKIEVQGSIIIIEFNNKRANWVFSKLFNRFNIELMAEKLREFAVRNKINYVNISSSS